MPQEVAFRLIEENDLASVMDLFRGAFPLHHPNEMLYRWHFMDNPVMPKSSAAAVVDGKIVAHAGFSGRKAFICAKDDLLFVKQTSMSAPSVRGTGIYSKLLTWANEQLLLRGGKIVLSYPNTNNHPVQILRDDYNDIYQIPALQKTFPQGVGPGYRADRVVVPSDDLPGRILHAGREQCNPQPFVFPQEYDELWRETLAGERFGIMRDAKYLTWRYAERPDIDYHLLEDREGGKLKSAIVWKFYPQEKPEKIMVVDWLHSQQDESAARLFEHLEDFAARCVVGRTGTPVGKAGDGGLPIALWQNVYRKKMHKIMEKRGYVPALPILYFGAFPLVDDTDSIDGFHDYRNWYVGMSDVDIF